MIIIVEKLPGDIRGYGDFLGLCVGKRLGICTRKNTSNDEANDDCGASRSNIMAVGIMAV